MTEIASSGSLVNALNSVRSDYHEHLKSIPQYEAFLLVESSTQRALETLDGFVNSRAPSIAAEVISSLETAKTKFKEHLASVPEYRALLAIDRLINDVSIDLGIQPAPAQTAVPAVEPGTPSYETTATQPESDLAVSPSQHTVTPEVAEIASTHQLFPAPPEPDLAASTSGHAVTPEVAEIASTLQLFPAQPEPDLAASPSEHAVMPEIAEIASTHQLFPAPPEPDLAVSASEHRTVMPEATEIASAHQMAPAQPEPDLAAALWDHAFNQLGIALTQSLTAAQIYSGAKEDAETGLPSGEIAPAPIEDLYVEPFGRAVR